MRRMIVRCGKCRVELEVSGPGEFLCPACGTRNAVRGGQQGNVDLGGLTVPGGRPPASASPPDEAQEGINWGTCPSCSFRFAMGEIETVTCPSCRAELASTPEGLRVAQG
jgi:Zn finger protein HypA/HybF involved in hydrogenase expression